MYIYNLIPKNTGWKKQKSLQNLVCHSVVVCLGTMSGSVCDSRGEAMKSLHECQMHSLGMVTKLSFRFQTWRKFLFYSIIIIIITMVTINILMSVWGGVHFSVGRAVDCTVSLWPSSHQWWRTEEQGRKEHGNRVRERWSGIWVREERGEGIRLRRFRKSISPFLVFCFWETF